MCEDMLEENKLSDEEARKLICLARAGDETAKEKLMEAYAYIIGYLVRKMMRPISFRVQSRREDWEEELCQRGWAAFFGGVGRFDLEASNRFSTYIWTCVSVEMRDELSFLINNYGITDLPPRSRAVIHETVDCEEIAETVAEESLTEDLADEKKTQDSLSGTAIKYLEGESSVRLALQILEVLKQYSSESDPITKTQLLDLLTEYRIRKYGKSASPGARNTITKTIEEILAEADPAEYTEESAKQYQILYSGYKEDRLKGKWEGTAQGKSATISDLALVHLFSEEQLDKLIQIVRFSDFLSEEEKRDLIGKLLRTASIRYRSPFSDGKMRFDPKAIHSRLSGMDANRNQEIFKSLNTIKEAINKYGRIRFHYNRYTSDHKLVHDGTFWELSPYHIVVYHEKYFCIGQRSGGNIYHLRIDLMTDVKIVKDRKGRMKTFENSTFAGAPLSITNWDPEKYMSEHIYMGYDDPQPILIKIKIPEGYTILQDWFGDHYEKLDVRCEEDRDIVRIFTSPSMIVPWAMQYGDYVEVLDKKIRDRICRKLEEMKERYEDRGE